MEDSLRKFLIDLAIGLGLTVLVCWAEGLFGAATPADTMRILCDGFFVAAAMLLAAGGLQWTYNGGVFDGLTFTFKVGVARIKRDYETAKQSFAEYREKREAKSSTPKYMVLAGLCHLAVAFILLGIYSKM